MDELIQKYKCSLRAARFSWYMLEADIGVTQQPEQRPWSLVRCTEFHGFQAWKRHKVWCSLRYARDTCYLSYCPWHTPRLLCVFRPLRVVSLILAAGTSTVFSASTMYCMPHAKLPSMMPQQLPPVPPFPLEYPPQYPLHGGYPSYTQQQPQAPWGREGGPWDYLTKPEADPEGWA